MKNPFEEFKDFEKTRRDLPLDEIVKSRNVTMARLMEGYEKLLEEEGIQVGYSTLTRLLRDLGLSHPRLVRCDRVPDEPGAEMQHDTTVYQVKLDGQRTKLIASLLYLRYSKRRTLSCNR